MANIEEGWKEFRDAVHGQISLHPLCVAIVDTPEFQRLRNISQCGMTHLVYPSACHSRFEHSLGVYHLANVMLNKIEDSGCKIDFKDKLSVLIAALCHDIGHGPFSHTWERFIHKAGSHFKHEDMSEKMLKYLIKKNKLTQRFEDYKIDDEAIRFICRLIKGECDSDLDDPKKWFLFEIVANKNTGVDVDRWDYILRDALHFGVKTELNYERILSTVRVIEVNGVTHIAFRDKVAMNIIEMFEIREKLHQICYQHRVNKIVEIMLIDAFLLADKFYKVKISETEWCKLSECHTNVEAFVKISDYLYYELLNSIDPDLSEGKEMIERMTTRKFYIIVSSHVIQESGDLKNIAKEMKEEFKKDFDLCYVSVKTETEKLQNIYCYDKNWKVIKFPGEFEPRKKEVLLYCKSVKEDLEPGKLEEMQNMFHQVLCSNNNYINQK